MKRRGNGLDADSYAPLIDLAPHLADAMLEALREAGVAAYVTPSPDRGEPGRSGADGDSLDRLYVDTAMRSAAEGVLHTQLTRLRSSDGEPAGESGAADTETGEPPRGRVRTGDSGGGTVAERDEEAIWAEIVASFDAAPADGQTPWPEQENLDEPADEGADRTGRLPTARVIKFPAAEEAAERAADDDDHYIPPPPPPLPSTDPITKAAWISLVGGPLYLLVTVMLGWDVPGWAAFLAVAAFIGGFVTLVLRMGDDPRDSDDGAVV
ncbi:MULTISPECIES: hypothetical protein [Thermomonospora]|uniref:DUF308 domain-containing protein n=1 Tax=Thermomonospora curvata (strain ATCC 19995 / DSM 43183 / JCM 3096 / KCTC 9072 / NBRC 15933 / NCIMB 10081 / Henssen B9) TaxID=471852 RepID=D1A8U9_THECD|nr:MULTISPECIES: hypothetical protein [Thermomonospora]ACY98587.1 hypothetical protein Tcur_3045 [Thermomonospora curvata DSM 43183]PKK13723.1 MAG: hypothetical protein BUE48_014850 [Thermomonospora sp. CIF 1]